MSSLYKNLSEEDLKPSSPKRTFSAVPKNSLGSVKVAIIFSFLLSFLALGGAAYLFQQMNAEKSRSQMLEAEKVQLEEKARSIQKSSQDSQDQLDALQERLQLAEGDREKLRLEALETKQQLVELKKQVQTFEKENQTLKAAAAKAQAAAVPSPAPEASEENADLDFAAETPVPSAKAPAPAAASAPVIITPGGSAVTPSALKPVVVSNSLSPAVKAAAPAAVSAPKTPQVLTVNRKFNFVVVSLGISDGLKIGDNLAVERDNKPVGAVQVEKLYANFSAATIVQEIKDVQIKEGDSVRRP